MNKQFVLGVLGGMGPESSTHFLHLLTKYSPVQREQDHMRVLVYMNPKTRDRTASILNRESLVKELQQSCNVLLNAGATKMVIICNTAHHYLPILKKKLRVPFYNLIDSTVDYITRRNIKTVLLLATEGTYISGLFERPLSIKGVNVIVPDKKVRHQIMSIIHDIKIRGVSIQHSMLLRRIIDAYPCDSIILGCTELSLLRKNKKMIDPLELMAKRIVLDYFGRVRQRIVS